MGFWQAFSCFSALRGKGLYTDFFSANRAHIRDCSNPPLCQNKLLHLGTPPGLQLLLSNYNTSWTMTSKAKDMATMTIHHEISQLWEVTMAGVQPQAHQRTAFHTVWLWLPSALVMLTVMLCCHTWSCILEVRRRVAGKVLWLDRSLALLLAATRTQLWQPGTCNTYRNMIHCKWCPSLATLIPILFEKGDWKKREE